MIYHYTKAITHLALEDYQALVHTALVEDCPNHDVTSEAIFSSGEQCRARLVTREDGVLAGQDIVTEIERQNPDRFSFEFLKKDGEVFTAGSCLAVFEGQLNTLLRVERVLLNFLQYISGIASETNRLVQSYPGLTILDTRKTLPAYRKIAKYAVYCGGGSNHRINLSDMAMIKDNHVAMFGSIPKAVGAIREKFPKQKVELEIDSLQQLDAAILAAPDILLLDNFTLADTQSAIAQLRQKAPNIFIECSGGITPEKLQALSKLGEGIGVSMGYLTHTTRFLDLSLDIERL
ncbi:MAG: carboxylating nicotinate-nucleotide diphosphorylase [Spirochaetota bacterium]